MKKIAAILIITLTVLSCSNEVKFSDPGFQGYKDNVLWKTSQVTATKSASTGVLTIIATNASETLQLNAKSASVGIYYFGTQDQTTKATFNTTINSEPTTYVTDAIQGAVATVETPLLNSGTNYTSDCTIVNGEYVCTTSHETTTTGAGAGLKVALITSAGKVTEVKIASPGNYYSPGDVITIVGGNNAASFKIQNIQGSNGQIQITQNNQQTISGKFRFNALKNPLNPQIDEILNFQYGEFFNIPITTTP